MPVTTLPRLFAKKRKESRRIGGEVEAHVSTFLTGGKVAEALSSSRISTALQEVLDMAVRAVVD